MSKTELARLYGPGLKDGSALNRLAAWMQRSPGLMEELEQTGYQRRQRTFTVRQLRIIYRYLEEP